MKVTLVCGLLALAGAHPAGAHRLDEYLQAALIEVTKTGIEVEIQLTPGVAVLPIVLAVIDQNRDGLISADEEQAYSARVAREVELKIDGTRAPLSLTESTFPAREAMREGIGTIRLKLRTRRTGRTLRFVNRHLPRISAYLVNCLAVPDLYVGPPVRDQAQRSIRFEYSFGAPIPPSGTPLWPFLPAVIGILLAGRAASLMYRRKATLV